MEEVTNQYDELAERYLKVFGSLPNMPVLVNISLIADLMQDAIISRIPVSQEDIDARVAEIDEPVDLEDEE